MNSQHQVNSHVKRAMFRFVLFFDCLACENVISYIMFETLAFLLFCGAVKLMYRQRIPNLSVVDEGLAFYNTFMS